jgi:hypothetical protein
LAVITKQALQRINLTPRQWAGWGFAAVELAVVYGVIQNAPLWWLALIVATGIELRGLLAGHKPTLKQLVAGVWERMPGLIVALSVILTVALLPRRASQIVILLAYGAWLVWRERVTAKAMATYLNLLLVQAVMFEAIFLASAIWQTPSWLILLLVWTGSYASIYSILARRGDRSAGVMAATWAVIATEVSWVLLLWLVTYTNKGGFVMVPQPALILTALAYVFGSILLSSRQGLLSRARLGEYLVIGVILVLIVVVETLWRHAS